MHFLARHRSRDSQGQVRGLFEKSPERCKDVRVSVTSSDESRPLSRSEQRERTHQRFVDATLEILEQEGTAGLSVSALARKVGVHHSLFYAHFKDLDACLGAVAARVIATLRPMDRDIRREMFKRAVTDRGALTRYFQGVFERWLQHRTVVSLLVAHRNERSAMGDALREALGEIRKEMTSELTELVEQLQVERPNYDEIGPLADLHLHHFLWALESLVDHKFGDRQLVASMLAELFVATNVAFFRRVVLPSYETAITQTFSDPARAKLDQLIAALRHLVRTRSDDELIARLGSGDARVAVEQVLIGMTQYFLPNMAQSPAVVLYRVHHAGLAIDYCAVVARRKCTIRTLLPDEEPRLVIESSLRTFLEAMSGCRHFDECHRSGDIRLGGDFFFAIEFIDWFYTPRAATTGQ